MNRKFIYFAAAVACLLVAVYGVLLALDVSFLLVVQVSDTINNRPVDTVVLSNEAVATEIPKLLPSLPNLPDAVEEFQPSLIDLILRSLGLNQ